MDFKIPKYPSERSMREERDRLKLKRKSGVNFGLDNHSFMKANLLPLSKRQLDRAAKNGQKEEAQAEQRRRKEGRKEAGLAGESYFKDYIKMVQVTGLNDQAYLEGREELLRKSVEKDSQALSTGHLAKTLALKGNLVEASKLMNAWKKVVAQNPKEKARWKKASLCLELYMTQKDGSQKSLTGPQWKAGKKKAKVTKEEVERIVKESQEKGYIYLFDDADEDLLKSEVFWNPKSQDQYGCWD